MPSVQVVNYTMEDSMWEGGLWELNPPQVPKHCVKPLADNNPGYAGRKYYILLAQV